MRYNSKLSEILMSESFHLQALKIVRALNLEDCWIAAGFVRNAVWNTLHDKPVVHVGDVDVIHYDSNRHKSEDEAIEAKLNRANPTVDWSVKNQAHMHSRNGDLAYGSSLDAMRHWPETATAVAARLTDNDHCEIAAPFGLEDLFALRLVPTPDFFRSKKAIFDERVESKRWLEQWPQLSLLDPLLSAEDESCCLPSLETLRTRQL